MCSGLILNVAKQHPLTLLVNILLFAMGFKNAPRGTQYF